MRHRDANLVAAAREAGRSLVALDVRGDQPGSSEVRQRSRGSVFADPQAVCEVTGVAVGHSSARVVDGSAEREQLEDRPRCHAELPAQVSRA